MTEQEWQAWVRFVGAENAYALLRSGLFAQWRAELRTLASGCGQGCKGEECKGLCGPPSDVRRLWPNKESAPVSEGASRRD